MLKDVIRDAVNAEITGQSDDYREEFLKLMVALQDVCINPSKVMVLELENLSNDDIAEKLYELAAADYEEKEKEFTPERLREIERVVLLRAVDSKWMDHIDNMEHLKQGIGLRAFNQIDPNQAYQQEGSEMFDDMIKSIKEETIKLLFHVRLEKAPERERMARETSAVHAQSPSESPEGPGSSTREPAVNPYKNVGRNDPCPCGSGKKFKNCCGKDKF